MRSGDTSTRIEALQNSLVRICGVGRVFCWFSGKGGCCTGTEAYLPKKGSTGQVQGLGVSMLVSQCWHYAVYYRTFSAYAGQWGKEMELASFFVPGEGSPCLLLSKKHSQKSE